jgi:restriction system protein
MGLYRDKMRDGEKMIDREVMPAFDMLMEELDAIVTHFNQQGAQLMQAKNYPQALEAINKAEAVLAYKAKLKALQDEWVHMAVPAMPKTQKNKKPVQRKMTKMLKQGLRTPNEAFLIPILQALVGLGGAARVKEVLDRVEEILSDQLNKYDYQPIPSNPNIIRWQNNAQWARLKLVQEGMLASDSPRGIWEITEAGRNKLNEINNQIRDQQANYTSVDNSLQIKSEKPTFELFKTYHRQTDLHDKYGGNRQAGIAVCAEHPFIFLFTSPTGDEFGYQDGWRSEDEYVYTGEGQLGDMEMTRGNLAIREHKADGRGLHLFKKVSSGRYGYVGEFEYQSHEVVRGEDGEGKAREVIRFVLSKVKA